VYDNAGLQSNQRRNEEIYDLEE